MMCVSEMKDVLICGNDDDHDDDEENSLTKALVASGLGPDNFLLFTGESTDS